MYCVMPGYAPVLLEAKIIKSVKANFKRTIHYSRLQTNLLNECNVVNTYPVGFGLIFVSGYHEAVKLMHPDIPQISDDDLGGINDYNISNNKGLDWIQDGKPIDVLHLFKDVVPTINHENVTSFVKQSMVG